MFSKTSPTVWISQHQNVVNIYVSSLWLRKIRLDIAWRADRSKTELINRVFIRAKPPQRIAMLTHVLLCYRRNTRETRVDLFWVFNMAKEDRPMINCGDFSMRGEGKHNIINPSPAEPDWKNMQLCTAQLLNQPLLFSHLEFRIILKCLMV